MLRFFTPVRIIIIALVLVALGLAPAVFAFVAEAFPRVLKVGRKGCRCRTSTSTLPAYGLPFRAGCMW
jgi:hypothetical protein